MEQNARVRYNVLSTTSLFDKRAAKNKIGPNFIHKLDSDLISKVILRCKLLNVPIYTIHDCIVTTIIHENLIKKIYFEVFLDLFFGEKDLPLRVFVKANCKEDQYFSHLKSLNLIETKVFDIKKKFKSGCLVYNHFVLKP